MKSQTNNGYAITKSMLKENMWNKSYAHIMKMRITKAHYISDFQPWKRTFKSNFYA